MVWCRSRCRGGRRFLGGHRLARKSAGSQEHAALDLAEAGRLQRCPRRTAGGQRRAPPARRGVGSDDTLARCEQSADRGAPARAGSSREGQNLQRQAHNRWGRSVQGIRAETRTRPSGGRDCGTHFRGRVHGPLQGVGWRLWAQPGLVHTSGRWRVESEHGRNMGPSSAGAVGPMQFIPSTREISGVDQ